MAIELSNMKPLDLIFHIDVYSIVLNHKVSEVKQYSFKIEDLLSVCVAKHEIIAK